MTPEDGRPESYLKILQAALSMPQERLAEYQATSVRLSRVVDARMTAAEYLRQFSKAVDIQKKRAGEPKAVVAGNGSNGNGSSASLPSAAPRGTVKNGLETLISMPEFFTTGVTLEDFAEARNRKEGRKMSKETYRKELIALMDDLKILSRKIRRGQGGAAYIYFPCDKLQALSSPDRDAVLRRILDIRELDRSYIHTVRKKDVKAKVDYIFAELTPVTMKQIEGRLINVMDIIHKINMDLYPAVPDDKTLNLVMPLEFIPQSMRMKFYTMVTRLNKNYPDLREKIIITTDRQDLVEKINELIEDPQNIVMAAVTDEKDLARLPHVKGDRLRALLFDSEPGDLESFQQVECVIAALRALYRSDARSLIKLSEYASNQLYSANEKAILENIDNPQALAAIFRIILKPIRVENQEMRDRLNSRLLELIRDAA